MALSSKECDPVDRMALKKTETQMEQSQADFTLSWNRKSKLLAWVVVNPRARASASLGVGGGGWGWKFCPIYGTYEKCQTSSTPHALVGITVGSLVSSEGIALNLSHIPYSLSVLLF